jgi:hypothetical protein
MKVNFKLSIDNRKDTDFYFFICFTILFNRLAFLFKNIDWI